MKLIELVAAVCAGAALIANTSLADESPAKLIHSESMTPERRIEHAMRSLFDKPGLPLKVAPVSVEGDYAVAGWIQSDRGGRALLKKQHGKWVIQLCGGDGLKQAENLIKAGMEPLSASRLSQKVATAENKMNRDRVRKFSMFEGEVRVDGGAHPEHN